MRPLLRSRHFVFLLFFLLSCGLFRSTLRSLQILALDDERYTHTVVVPFLSAILVFIQRRRVFSNPDRQSLLGLPLLMLAILFSIFPSGPVNSASAGTDLFMPVASLVLLWVAGFALLHGTAALTMAVFPICFLMLTIPLPGAWLDHAVVLFQRGSAEATAMLFKLTGVPVFRQGMSFTLPGVTIEVAKECGGIRSSIGLFITGLLAGYLLLRSTYSRLALVLVTIPITILKNGVRIVTLSLLGAYLSIDYLLGALHRFSGLPFSVLSFSLLFLVLLALHRLEAGRAMRPSIGPPPDPAVAAGALPGE